MLNVAVMSAQDQNGGWIGLSNDDAWTMSPIRLFEAHIGTRKPQHEIFNFPVASTHEQCSNFEAIIPTLGIVAIPLALKVHLLSRDPWSTSSNWLNTFCSSLTSHIPKSRSSPGSPKGPGYFCRSGDGKQEFIILDTLHYFGTIATSSSARTIPAKSE
ncbi:hypothetical protein BD779DRAFT_1544261 [Infundibulicybe gibba]|nr:hypothetical protein BD779DRAFT_1544261 [Infundibulicybe gibba]